MKAHTANIKFNTIDLIKADVHKKKKKSLNTFLSSTD